VLLATSSEIPKLQR